MSLPWWVRTAHRSAASGEEGAQSVLYGSFLGSLPWFLWAVVLLAGCSEAPQAAMRDDASLRGRLVLTGSSTIAPLAAEIGKRFERENPEARVDVQTGGSSRGIRDVARGAADVGMSSRPLKDEEKEGLVAKTMARDGVGFLVHSTNPVTDLSNEQLAAIYTGKISEWQDVGGQDAPIVVINRAEGRSELDLVTEFWGIETPDIVADVIAGENQQGIKAVAGNPNAIVYMSIGSSEQEIARGEPIRLLPLGGVEATAATVRSGAYPLARPLILVSKAEGSGSLVDAFINFATSSEVEDLVEAQAFVPIEH